MMTWPIDLACTQSLIRVDTDDRNITLILAEFQPRLQRKYIE